MHCSFIRIDNDQVGSVSISHNIGMLTDTVHNVVSRFLFPDRSIEPNCKGVYHRIATVI